MPALQGRFPLRVLLLISFSELTSFAISSNILMFPFNMGSRFTYFGELGKLLVANGHNVTMIFGEKMKIPSQLKQTGIHFEFYHMKRELVLKNPDIARNIMDAAIKRSMIGILNSFKKLGDLVTAESEEVFLDEALIQRLKEANFHFAVSDVLFPMTLLPYKLNIPFSIMAIDYFWWTYRLPINPSYIPSAVTVYGDDMTFMERTINALVHVITTPLFYGSNLYDKVALYAPERPLVGYNELQSRPSLVLRLQNLAMDYPRPLPPNVVNVGGLIARPALPLSGQLSSFVEGANDGIIVVSFGSWFDQLPTEVALKFINAFAKIPQRIVWKFTPSPTLQVLMPENVRTLSWMPQNDLLGHNKTRLFITHCGIGGTTESLYHAVPMLAVPMALDQHGNAQKAKSKGYGEVIDISNFSSEEIIIKVTSILEGTHRAKVRALSAILKDLPKGGDTAVFWIEHVIQFGDKHLRTKAFDLPWYQYMMLDVMFVWTLLFVIFIYLSKVIVCKAIKLGLNMWYGKKAYKTSLHFHKEKF